MSIQNRDSGAADLDEVQNQGGDCRGEEGGKFNVVFEESGRKSKSEKQKIKAWYILDFKLYLLYL